MKLIVLTHPKSLDSTSMPRFARMIGENMRERGYSVDYWTSPMLVGNLGRWFPKLIKWLGYIDQFIIYPPVLWFRTKRLSEDALVVVADQALGMWVPFITSAPHVVHVHDFMALKSSLGEFPENPTSSTGKIYQELIKRGFGKASHFISVSERTREDLDRFLPSPPLSSQVVYNGLNGDFGPLSLEESRTHLMDSLPFWNGCPFLMHIGGNQWYKNRAGVIEIYRAWAANSERPIPLWMVGAPPPEELEAMTRDLPPGAEVRFVRGLSDEQVRAAYSATACLIFPSLEEGFGWPIAEAMACGAPVLTTGQAPMTEVGGDAAYYLRRRNPGVDMAWATEGAVILDQILNASSADNEARRHAGFAQARKFSTDSAIDAYEGCYRRIMAVS